MVRNSATGVKGADNCLAWTVDTGIGTVAYVGGDWNTLDSPWDATLVQCNSPESVWCVQD